ncbi:hypothetical protein CXU19_09015 [Akkermansia muciniphila]|nr:hypothetical protein CXU19_09015 [Akkermansia muciniphila]PNC38217.1 hypothetical protein CXU20_10635 [Akkermansia muciniphila]
MSGSPNFIHFPITGTIRTPFRKIYPFYFVWYQNIKFFWLGLIVQISFNFHTYFSFDNRVLFSR